jgi:hypothetical protein
MSAANPNPMEKSIVSVLVVANAGAGSLLPCGVMVAEFDQLGLVYVEHFFRKEDSTSILSMLHLPLPGRVS